MSQKKKSRGCKARKANPEKITIEKVEKLILTTIEKLAACCVWHACKCWIAYLSWKSVCIVRRLHDRDYSEHASGTGFLSSRLSADSEAGWAGEIYRCVYRKKNPECAV